jgi:hypothetical protein
VSWKNNGNRRLLDLASSGTAILTSCQSFTYAEGENAENGIPTNNTIFRSGSHTNTGSDNGLLLRVSGATFEMYNTVLNGSGLTVTMNASSGKNGAMILLKASSRVVMHSGTIVGATTKSTQSNSHGAAVSLHGTGARFDMISGTIRDGKANQWGGNVHITSSGTFTMYSGQIVNGTINTNNHGGNVEIQDGNFVMYGGLISGGAVNTNATANADKASANIDFQKGTMVFYGGTVHGRIQARGTGTKSITISGNTKIVIPDSNSLSGNTLAWVSGTSITIGELGEEAQIGLRILTDLGAGQQIATVTNPDTFDMTKVGVSGWYNSENYACYLTLEDDKLMAYSGTQPQTTELTEN